MPPKRIAVKIIGVGTAGVSMVEAARRSEFAGATFAAVDTDAASLSASTVPEKIFLEGRPMRGLAAGADSARGGELAEASAGRLKSLCAGAEVVFMLAGLGGGAATGIGPVLARVARESGGAVLAFVTLPFDCEANRRRHKALAGLEHLGAAADGVLCLPCQKTGKLVDENAALEEVFQVPTRLLLDGVRGIWRLLAYRGLIQIHPAELLAVLREHHGECCFASVEGVGESRAGDAAGKLFAHPMLDGGERLADADAVLVSLLGGPDLTLAGVNCIMARINQRCRHAEVIMGAATDEAFRDRLAVTVIATRRGERTAPEPRAVKPEATSAPGDGPGFDSEVVHRRPTRRPASRLVPPAPPLSETERENILRQQTGPGARQRKNSSRLRQGQLPLEIISKSRFDKTEPTVHKGEDLDVPTYIRRGVAMN